MPDELPMIRTVIDFLVLIVVGCHTGFAIWDRRNKVTQGVVQALREEVFTKVSTLQSDLDLRRRRVDENIEHMKERIALTPTREDLTRLHCVISDATKIANELRGAVQSVQNTVQMINQHLLERAHG